jgi:hypothetical protein
MRRVQYPVPSHNTNRSSLKSNVLKQAARNLKPDYMRILCAACSITSLTHVSPVHLDWSLVMTSVQCHQLKLVESRWCFYQRLLSRTLTEFSNVLTHLSSALSSTSEDKKARDYQANYE